jgi:hypothetical protein
MRIFESTLWSGMRICGVSFCAKKRDSETAWLRKARRMKSTGNLNAMVVAPLRLFEKLSILVSRM